MDTLWVVCPSYHDIGAFCALRLEIAKEVGRMGALAPARLRFLLIDDTGGEDPELGRLEGMDDVQRLAVPFNLGNQRAIVFGLRSVAGELADRDRVVTMDSDGEDRPADLPRLLAALAEAPAGSNQVVLATRARRREALWFRLLYLGYRLQFRLLTGINIRTGNYAAFHGALARRVLFHPYFDLSYASALLSLNIPARFVACERGTRHSGESKMDLAALLRHGLRMLMPFIDRIAVRALVLFTAILAVGIAAAAGVLSIKLFTDLAIPGWTSSMLLLILTVSFAALGNFLILFVLFAESESLAMRGLHEQRHEPAAGGTGRAGGAPAGAGRAGEKAVLAPPALAGGRDGASRTGRV